MEQDRMHKQFIPSERASMCEGAHAFKFMSDAEVA